MPNGGCDVLIAMRYYSSAEGVVFIVKGWPGDVITRLEHTFALYHPCREEVSLMYAKNALG